MAFRIENFFADKSKSLKAKLAVAVQ